MTAGAAITLLHVAAGTLVLVVAPAAIVVRKGGRWHRRWGAAFVYGMVAVLATAAFMWQANGHLFLLLLDVVCAYLVFQGLRVIARRRRRGAEPQADRIDLGAALAVLTAVAALLTVAFTARGDLLRALAPILIAIAAIAAAFAGLDLQALRSRRQSRVSSLLVHLSAMIGAYVSAVTAFCVINLHHVSMSLRWVVPSVAGTLVISGFSAIVRHRGAQQARRARTAD